MEVGERWRGGGWESKDTEEEVSPWVSLVPVSSYLAFDPALGFTAQCGCLISSI